MQSGANGDRFGGNLDSHMEDLKKLIREVPDFPKPGILFYDITTLLKDKLGFRAVIDGLRHHYQDAEVDVVLGIEARGFIFAPALAYALRAGFVPVRKPKKLPAECVSVTYELEYGSDTLEMHKDAVGNGCRVLAKINLDLRVLGVRSDGYHEIRTIFQTVSLADTLDIAFTPGGRTSIELVDSAGIADNLATHAARLTLDAMRVKGSVSMRL